MVVLTIFRENGGQNHHNILADSWKKFLHLQLKLFWLTSGRNQGVVFTGVVFAKGCEFLLVSLEEGFGVGLRWVEGSNFLWGMRGKGKGAGRVGVGTGKGTGKSMRTRLSKLPFIGTG